MKNLQVKDVVTVNGQQAEVIKIPEMFGTTIAIKFLHNGDIAVVSKRDCS